MRILLSNDDGVHAAGLRAIYEALRTLGDVWVVAPLEEKSTTGHSLTLHKPLRVLKMETGAHAHRRGQRIPDGRFFGINGSPADCVNMGMREIMRHPPDLVVSGINRGANLGQDVFYSGTVSAAREACIQGVRAMAVSLAIDFNKSHREQDLHYEAAAKIAVRLLRHLRHATLPVRTLLNLNVPNLPLARVRGVRLARQGFRNYSGTVVKRKDHRGRPYFWVGGQYQGFERREGTDCVVVDSGFASLTPMRLDATDLPCLVSLGEVGTELKLGGKR